MGKRTRDRRNTMDDSGTNYATHIEDSKYDTKTMLNEWEKKGAKERRIHQGRRQKQRNKLQN